MQFLDVVKHAGRRLNAPLIGFPGLPLTESTVRENLNDPALQAKTIKALHGRFPFDIVFPMMDLTVESEAFGAEIDWELDEMPSIRGILVSDMAQAEALKVPEIGVGNRLNNFVETCSLLRCAFPEKLVWGYVLGPFSISGRLIGMTEVALATKLEPELVHTVLRASTELLKNYIKALLDTGIDGVMILEPASSMLRADDANEFSNCYVKELVDVIRGAGKTSALHNCGNIDHLIEHLCATGIDALHVNVVCNMRDAYQRMPENVVLMGNIDPAGVLLNGSPEVVRRTACSILDQMSDFDRFVLSSGCDVPPGTSLDNVDALAESLELCDPNPVC